MNDTFMEQLPGRVRTNSQVGESSENPAVPSIKVPGWAWAVAAAAILVVYVAGFDNGAILGNLAPYAHEFFHNTRHFAAFPCH